MSTVAGGVGPRRRVLLVEPFMGGSHAAWAAGVVRHSRHDVHLIDHPGLFWRWRMRGGPLTLAARVDDWVRHRGRPDVVLVSALTDVASLLGLARRALSATPVVVYLHENQLTYPRPDRRPPHELGYRNWLSMAVADRVLVNSFHHRRDVFAALEDFLPLAPDLDHADRVPAVRARTHVVPVGVELASLLAARRAPQAGPPVVVWNHRFDTDKRPERVFAVLTDLAREGIEFRVAITGFDDWPGQPRLRELTAALGDRVVEHGWLEPRQYRDVLVGADVVVSAARHEFFGVSVVEAVAAGAVPVLPNDLSYPEVIPPSHHRATLYETDDLEPMLRAVLTDLAGAQLRAAGLREAMRVFDWSRVAPLLDRHLDEVAVRSGP